MSSKEGRKPGLISRLFSSGFSRDEDQKERSKKRLQRLHSVDVTTFRDKNSSALFDDDIRPKKELKPVKEEGSGEKSKRKQSMPVASLSLRTDSKSARSQKKGAGGGGGGSRGGGTGSASGGPKRLRHRKKNSSVSGIQVDTTKPLEFPATPEIIYEYHKRKPFLDKNEEWLVMELNEYECLVENLEVIKIIAKHSKFFEVEPDELWEEFFEFMEEVPSYDEMINYDVWQEFRDNKYPC